MPHQSRVVASGPDDRTIRTVTGEILIPPDAVTLHATPVGSGTVARTERIPINERTEAESRLT